MIRLTFECGGCDAKETVPCPPSYFTSFSGGSSGLGLRHYPRIEEQAPPGWVAYDPYTFCQYCPTCWAEIEDGVEAALPYVPFNASISEQDLDLDGGEG
jgi:hypothetical protein